MSLKSPGGPPERGPVDRNTGESKNPALDRAVERPGRHSDQLPEDESGEQSLPGDRSLMEGPCLSEEPVYVMSVAARMVRVHPQTLRLYERVGLVRPSRANNTTHGNRLYSEADIERLRQIQRFTQEMGVNLAGVEVILELLNRMEWMRAQTEREMERMRREVEEMRRRFGG